MNDSHIRFVKIAQKIIKLGPKKSLKIIKNRFAIKLFRVYWRHKALKHQANHTWAFIANKYSFKGSINCFFEQSRSSSFFKKYICLTIDKQELSERADAFVEKKFDILGSGMQHFDRIPWHIDFRLKKQNPQADYTFATDQFYQDVTFGVGQGDELTKDIKVPWELSRCQHLLIVAQAYERTGNGVYVQAFQEHVSDWIKNNPFMLGANWVCPMEVGLRAVNWILAARYVSRASISTSFWHMFIASLYDHMFYLEHNWEIYDGRTSNHYLSDLIGYLYVCDFFKELDGVKQKREWCFAQIVAECEKQVFAEGTSYEGSTAYHRLVTELFLHGYILAYEAKLEIPTKFTKKITAMLEFIDWCTTHNGAFITIGDHDSGCVTLAGITQEMRALFSVSQGLGRKDFPEFGVSIIKNDAWHVTLRHHAYQAHQPSGHFHNDVGSITVALHGIPLFVDPGSYIYTPSRTWRNNFRSARMHNTVFVEDQEPILFDEQLFALHIPEKKSDIFNYDKNSMIMHHELYERIGLSIKRETNLSKDTKILYITDYILHQKNIELIEEKLVWNFIVSPKIQVVIKGKVCYFKYENKPLAIMDSEQLQFRIVPTWVSLEYGQKQQALALQAVINKNQIFQDHITISIHV